MPATPDTAARRTRPAAVPVSLVAKAVPSELLVVGALSTPAPDLAGDVVIPSGLDFRPHARTCEIDLEHARGATGTAAVAWARKSLSRPGDYSTAWATVDYQGRPTRLPFAHAYFDPSDPLQHQAFALYDRGALTGFSLEFVPVECKSRGFRSPLEGRDAMEFTRASVVRYTCCAVPVCPDAVVVEGGVVRKATAAPAQVPHALATILSSGRVGAEQLHPTIAKALAHHLPAKQYHRVTEAKAMNETETVYDAADPDPGPGPDGDGGDSATPTAQAAYDAGQMLSDACAQIEDALGKSEHVAGKKKLMALCDQLKKLGEKAVAIGDQVAADVGGSGDMDEDDEEPPVESEDMEPDDDGVLKAFKSPVRKAYRPRLRRFTLAEVKKGVEAPDPAAEAARKENQRLRRKFAELHARNG